MARLSAHTGLIRQNGLTKNLKNLPSTRTVMGHDGQPERQHQSVQNSTSRSASM
jgi:hypothetical protein